MSSEATHPAQRGAARTGPGHLGPAGQWTGVALVAAFLVAALFSDLLDPQAAFEAPALRGFLDATFMAGGSVLVGLFALRAYLTAGSPFFLWIGAGGVAVGVATLAAGLCAGLPAGAGAARSIHYAGLLGSAACYAVATRLAQPGQVHRLGPRSRRSLVAALVAVEVLAFGALAAAAASGRVPDFFAAGHGPTLVRQAVLALCLALYTAVGATFLTRFSRTRAAPFYWVWVGLSLAAIGVGAVFIRGSEAGVVGAVAQAALYASAACCAWALRDAARWARAHRLPLDEAMTLFLAGSEADYRSLVDALSAAVITVDGAGRIILWNGGAERLLGRRRREALGAPLVDLLGPTLALRARLPEEAAAETGARFASELSVGDRTVPVEVQLLRPDPDGQALTLIIEDVSARRAAEERIRELHAGLERQVEERTRELERKVADLEEARRALAAGEAELEQRQEFFRALLEHSPDISGVIGPGGRFQYMSASVRGVLGWTEAEVAGFGVAEDLAHPDDRHRALEALRSLQAEPDGQAQTTLRVLHKDGSHRLMELDGRNLLHHPIVRGLVIHARDVTARHLLEAQLRQAQKLESIGRLAGGVAHDFNNALTVIMAGAEGLGRDLAAGRPPDRADVDDILSSSRRSRDIVRQLLAFARKQVAAPVSLDLGEMIRGNEKMIRRLVGEAVTLELALPPGLWPIRLDPTHLDQILLNLAANSRDALPEGGRVEIRGANLTLGAGEAPPGLAPGDYVRLEFRDDGLGMDPEVQAHAFEPFFTTKEAGSGTGLGLATVHGIVSQGGGHVGVRSTPGRGTTFTVHFPRCLEAPAPAPEVARRAAEAAAEETILLVEDDTAVRTRVLRDLEQAGYRVLACADGAESLDLLRAEGTRPDLVLSDVVMPRLDGRRLAVLLRERWPDQRIMFMSGYGPDQQPGGNLGIPGADLLEKPFSRATLLQRIRSALGRAPSA